MNSLATSPDTKPPEYVYEYHSVKKSGPNAGSFHWQPDGA